MSKKRKKQKLPKQVGGVKLPKGIRQAGSEILAWASTPEGRGAIAALLSAGAAFIGGTKPGQQLARQVGHEVGQGGEKASVTLQNVLSALAVGAASLLAPAKDKLQQAGAPVDPQGSRPH